MTELRSINPAPSFPHICGGTYPAPSHTPSRHSRTLPRHSREGGNLGGGVTERVRSALPRHSRGPYVIPAPPHVIPA